MWSLIEQNQNPFQYVQWPTHSVVTSPRFWMAPAEEFEYNKVWTSLCSFEKMNPGNQTSSKWHNLLHLHKDAESAIFCFPANMFCVWISKINACICCFLNIQSKRHIYNNVNSYAHNFILHSIVNGLQRNMDDLFVWTFVHCMPTQVNIWYHWSCRTAAPSTFLRGVVSSLWSRVVSSPLGQFSSIRSKSAELRLCLQHFFKKHL